MIVTLPKGWKSLRMTTIPKLWIMCGNLPKSRRNVSDGNMPEGWTNGGPTWDNFVKTTRTWSKSLTGKTNSGEKPVSCDQCP